MSLPSRQLSLRRLAAPHVLLIIRNNNPPQEANNDNGNILYVCSQIISNMCRPNEMEIFSHRDAEEEPIQLSACKGIHFSKLLYS